MVRFCKFATAMVCCATHAEAVTAGTCESTTIGAIGVGGKASHIARFCGEMLTYCGKEKSGVCKKAVLDADLLKGNAIINWGALKPTTAITDKTKVDKCDTVADSIECGAAFTDCCEIIPNKAIVKATADGKLLGVKEEDKKLQTAKDNLKTAQTSITQYMGTTAVFGIAFVITLVMCLMKGGSSSEDTESEALGSSRNSGSGSRNSRNSGSRAASGSGNA